ncbi:probable ATP-dependent DNA helicase HFM1 [Pararge aegeria]|uniref:probable ATP-dependent DNA helicase HFM1 n=1 Tax=Pararge aegeria TaxID=116150 RepID=UPI0019D2CD5D|nr:probable ATP-dependent DNA helicase HFM1 [Pararge aegeria]
MAIVQLLMELEDINYSGDFKIIYMAPVKALCTERLTEWHSKFTKLGLLCIEVTGDTDVEFPQLKPYRIIITTPEKWDMLTRRWKDHRGLVEAVKLFLIDEVHILNDEIRGPVLEAVVSRMKTIETSVQSAHRIEQVQAQFQGADIQCPESSPRIRFVAVSATVSNPEDVAAWLGNREQPAAYYKFGDECRPVKLKRVVEGYPCPNGTSIFKFDIILNYKLWPIIQKYHNGKPTLIFCNTRKGVVLTAETLSREITVTFNQEQKIKLDALASTLKNKKVQSLILNGVGCHHAGLLYEERTNIEQAFRNRDLPILVTTTTLAMGVNLPAHLVIIKNTQQYVNGAYQEYSISTVLQMVGRAGRPQFDTEATAVIMTRVQDKPRYQALVGGCEPLQSYLHKRLAENLNSEAALGSVGDVAQCVQWVNSTFLSVRAARDPKRYLSLAPSAPAALISKKIEELCVRAMNGLESAGLITMNEACCIESTEAGRLMSLYYLDLETMKLIMKLEGTESLERLLWLVCESHELSDMHLRVDERRCLNTLNRNNAAATIRFPMKGKISSRQMKLNCIIQAVLGCLPIPDPSLNQEAMKIMRTADRVCKCLVSYVTRSNLMSQNPKFYSTILNSLILAKCISAHLWENSLFVSRQLKGIGPTYSALLASAGKTNFMILEESHPRDLERIMNKGPPAGNILRKQISLLPKYNLTMTPVNERMVRIQLSLLNQAHLAENMENLTAGANHKCHVIVGDSDNFVLFSTTFKETDFIALYEGCITFDVTRKHTNEHKILAHCISTTFVGIDEKCEYLFMDLNQHFLVSETFEKNYPSIQATDTDVSQARKRKLFDKNDTIPSKEKKKRNNNLMDTFKTLKESIKKTAEEIKLDFDKKTDISHNLTIGLTNSKLPINNNSFNTSLNHIGYDQYEIQDLGNAFSEDFESEDMDEDKVKGILSEIEKEIKHRTYKKKDCNDETEITEGGNEICFSETVKSQIEKYLRRTEDTLKTKNSITDIKDFSNTIDTDINLKEPVHLKYDCKYETNNNNQTLHILDSYENKFQINAEKGNQKIYDFNDATNKEDKSTEIVEKTITNRIVKDTDKVTMQEKFLANKQQPLINCLPQFYIESFNKLPISMFQNSDVQIIHESEKKQSCVKKECSSENTKNFHYNGDVNSFKSNSSKEKIESINRYFFGDTKIFNICTKNTSKKHVCMIGKLKVELDITEIVYNKIHQIPKYIGNNLYPEFDNDAKITLRARKNDISNNKVATLKSFVDNEVKVKLNPCFPKEDKINLSYSGLFGMGGTNTNYNENNNDIINNNTMTLSKEISNNSSIKNILQRISHSFKEEKNYMNKNDTKNYQFENVDNPDIKPMRKYKIKDIDKIQIPLPQSLIVENFNASHNVMSQLDISIEDSENKKKCHVIHHTNQNYNKKKFTQDYPIPRSSNAIDICNEIQQSNLSYNNHQIQNYSTRIPEIKMNIDEDIEEEPPEIHSPDIMLSRLYSVDDYDLNQVILNPKTLLECLNKEDNAENVSPSPEIYYNNTCGYSPIYCDNFNAGEEVIKQVYEESHSNDTENFETTNLFESNSPVDLTPSKEVETWTLSEDVRNGLFHSDKRQSYTMMHKNHNESKRESQKYAFYPNNSRQAKLSYFKFERKRVFKKI